MTRSQTVPIVHKDTGEIIGHRVAWQAPHMRTQWNFDREQNSIDTGTSCPEETLAQQQFKDECDINTILDRFGITGTVPTNVRQPLSEDFVDTMDYQSALNALIEAESAFMEMPAKIRAEFDNDPGRFIEFFEREENRERAIKLGLINKPAETPPQGAVPPPVPPTPGQA